MSQSIQISVSKKCPPWAGNVSATYVVVKVGNKFVTVEVKK